MLFGKAIAGAQARDVVVVEGVELHGILDVTLLHAGQEGLRNCLGKTITPPRLAGEGWGRQ
jgi:hypothetical protein